MNTKNIIKVLKNLKDSFDFSNLNENHEIFSNEIKKVVGKVKMVNLRNMFYVEKEM